MMRAQLQQQQQQQQPNGAVASISDPSAAGTAQISADSPTAAPALEPLQNRAGESKSPYVRRHAETRVAWQPLDRRTIDRATQENKPIFLHIGFLADHHCRLTTQDSFSNPTVAEFLNDAFIPVIVDREEHPELDTIYQNYSEAVNATGGWPLNLFLTPDLYPIFGGTYWPGPGTEHALAGDTAADDTYTDFLAISRKIHKFWVEQEERCRREAFEMLSKLQDFAQEGTLGQGPLGAVSLSEAAEVADLDIDQIDEALSRILRMFDHAEYGFGTPKFPNPARLSFLLRLAHFPQEVRDIVGDAGVDEATSIALGTLRRIRDRGLHDHLGAGFFRFSVTRDWSVPHFEKMVGENALLLGVFLDAWLGQSKALAASDEFANVVFELADYLSADMRRPDSGFTTSEAADSFYRKGDRHMREGACYLWTRREFDQVVGANESDSQHNSSIAAAHWNVRENGNVPREQDPYDEFINQNVLSAVKDELELSRQFGIPLSEVQRILSSSNQKLRLHREKERTKPERDEKAIVYVNGMVISALARTAAAVQDVDPQRATKYLEAASRAAAFVKEKLGDSATTDGPVGRRLRRFYLDGASETEAFAEDYAFLIEGLLDLYEATLDKEWLNWASELQDEQLREFYDHPEQSATTKPSSRRSHSGGFYSTREETFCNTILRLKSGMDKSQPSTNAVSASNLFRIGTLLANSQYIHLAKGTINAFESEILQYPWLFVSLLTGVVAAKLGVKKVELSAGDKDGLRRYRTSPRAEARVLVLGTEQKSEAGQPLKPEAVAGDGKAEESGREAPVVTGPGKPQLTETTPSLSAVDNRQADETHGGDQVVGAGADSGRAEQAGGDAVEQPVKTTTKENTA